MKDLADIPVGQIVAEDYRAATILKNYRIDFCCQGGVSLAQACAKKNVSIWKVLDELGTLDNKTDENIDYRQWPADLLCDYIEKKHHRYVRQRVKEIAPFLQKVARVHGAGYPELIAIRDLFQEASSNLLQHMEKEEEKLFPAIRAVANHTEINDPGFYEDLIAQLKEEHQLEGERFAKIAELSNNYNPPQEACNTYRVSYALLKEFEDDLHQHIHLENNILFSKIQELQAAQA